MKEYSSIRLEITSRCNLKCDYCHNSEFSNRDDDMTTEEILRLIESIKKKYPINKILLTGGEPLVQKDVYKIIKKITSLGIKADMVTNGTLITDEVIKNLEEAGLSRIRISIDEVGDSSEKRGSTNPNKLWEVAKNIVNNSEIEVCIHTVCSPSNVLSLPEVYKKVLEVGAKRWRVFDLGYQGGIDLNKNSFNFDFYYQGIIESTKQILNHYINNDLQNVLDIEINNIFRTEMLNYEYKDVNIDEALKVRLLSSPCNYISDHQLTIRSNGKATLCQYFRNTIFDFAKYHYNADVTVQNEIYVHENNLLMKDLNSCSTCKFCLVCNSGCRSRSKYLTCNITDADPTACYLIPRIYNEIVPLLPTNTQKVFNSYINKNGHVPKYRREDLLKLLHFKGF